MAGVAGKPCGGFSDRAEAVLMVIAPGQEPQRSASTHAPLGLVEVNDRLRASRLIEGGHGISWAARDGSLLDMRRFLEKPAASQTIASSGGRTRACLA